MSDYITQMIANALAISQARTATLERALREANAAPALNVLQLRTVLKAYGLAIIESDALRVALDQFDVADKVEDDGLSAHADWADVDRARAAIEEAWKASK